MSETQARLLAAFTGRSTLVVFFALAVGGFLPGLVPSLAPVLYPLVLPAYLVSTVVYEGGLLESVIYVVEGSVAIDGSLLWDIGQAATFYLFAVAAALLGGVLERRLGPAREPSAAGTRLRYVVAGGLLLIGVGLLARGIVTQPMMTSVTCEGSASAAGNVTATATLECTRTTEPATGQRLYILGLGTAIGLLGGAVVVVDRWLAGEQ